jgi:hypothetical protein
MVNEIEAANSLTSKDTEIVECRQVLLTMIENGADKSGLIRVNALK